MKKSILSILIIISLNAYSIPQLNIDKKSRERGPAKNPEESVEKSQGSTLVGKPTKAIKCESSERNISLSFFKGLISSSEHDSLFSVESFDETSKRLEVSLPKYVGNCLDIKLKQSKTFSSGNAQFVRLMIENNKDMSAYEGNSMEEKIEDCLKTEEVVQDNDGVEAYNTDKIKFSSAQMFDFKISGEIDTSKQLSVVFGSPNGSDYANPNSVTNKEEFCFSDESINEGLTSLIDQKKADDNRIINLCESLNLDEIQAELEKKAELEPYQSDLLYQVLRQAQEKYAEEKLAEIESVGRKILESDNEMEVELLGKEYVSLLDDLEKEIINPSKKELAEWGMKARNAKTNEEFRAINREINKLSSIIGGLSNTSKSRTGPKVLDKLLENGLTDYANRAAEVRIKSNEYSKAKRYLYASKGKGGKQKSVSQIFSGIDKIVSSEYKKFKYRSDEALIVYEQRTGITKLSPGVKREIDMLTRKRDIAFQNEINEIQQELAKCNKNVFGIMIHPTSCKNALRNQNEWYRDALSRKEQYNRQISSLASKYQRYVGYEKEAVESQKLEMEEDDISSRYSSNRDSNYLGSYGLLGDFSDSGKPSTQGLDHPELASRTFSIGNDPAYQAFFSNPSRMNPYSNFSVNPSTGYNFGM